MEADLPIIPCYEDNNCDTEFNCGGGGGLMCDYQSAADADPDSIEFCDPSLDSSDSRVRGSCYGSNPNACNGIQSCCDPSVAPADLSCNTSSGFAKNGDGLYIGCTISSEDKFNCGEYKSSCMEFDRFIDKQVDTDSVCWLSGGNKLVKTQCEMKIGDNENMCKAMEYFCDWDSQKNLCTVSKKNLSTPPFVNFNNKYSAPTSVLFLRKDCNNNNNSDCIEHTGLDESDNGRYYVNTARSSWNSKKETSVHPLSRINCVHDTKTGEKVCINLPRCQVVDNRSECGSIETRSPFECTNNFENILDPPCSNEEKVTDDLLFMCAKTNFYNTDGNTNTMGEGYITWCKGTQTKKDYEIPSDREKYLINLNLNITPITKIDWWEYNPGNRCNNYNECESVNSEELWNRCIFDKSGGVYGLDYNTQTFLSASKNKRKELLRNDGMCADTEASDWPIMFDFIKECETELESLGSINWGRVFGPGQETAACQYRYNWEHTCTKGADNKQISENYLCTWCPNLQCKIGSRDEICSEIGYISSYNILEYCDTDSNHGTIVDNPLIPDNCECFLPKTNRMAKAKTNNEFIYIIAITFGLSLLIILIGFSI
jgi:hypothetical protein